MRNKEKFWPFFSPFFWSCSTRTKGERDSIIDRNRERSTTKKKKKKKNKRKRREIQSERERESRKQQQQQELLRSSFFSSLTFSFPSFSKVAGGGVGPPPANG